MGQSNLRRVESFLQNTDFGDVKNYQKNKRHLLGVINGIQKSERDSVKQLIPLLNKAIENMKQAQLKLQSNQTSQKGTLVRFIKNKWYGSVKLETLVHKVEALARPSRPSKKTSFFAEAKRRLFESKEKQIGSLLLQTGKISPNEVVKISQLAKSALKETKAYEIESAGHSFIVTKGKWGSIDVLAKEKLLGKGSFGQVYQAVSVKTGKMKALKYASNRDEAKQNLQNEVRILSILNRNGSVEGVQRLIKVSVLAADGKEQGVISVGKLYSQGALGALVGLPRLAKVLQIDENTLLTASKSEINEGIQRRLDHIRTNKTEYKNFIFELSSCVGSIHREKSTISDEDSERLRRQFGRPYPDEDTAKMVLDVIALTLGELVEAVRHGSKLNTQIPLNEKMHMGANIVNGLMHMHRCGVIHGDIKPDNFLLNQKGAVIADMGGSRTKEDLHKDDNLGSTPDYGPGDYLIAMRAYRKNRDKNNLFLCGKAFDMRATGVSLYEMFTGGFLPLDRGDPSYYEKKTYDDMRLVMIKTGVDPRAAEIISKMATPHPIDTKKPPQKFPLPVSDNELRELAAILERS